MAKQSSGTLVSRLKAKISVTGPAKVAVGLGEWDTQTVKRWVRKDGDIPITKRKLVEHYLNGDL